MTRFKQLGAAVLCSILGSLLLQAQQPALPLPPGQLQPGVQQVPPPVVSAPESHATGWAPQSPYATAPVGSCADGNCDGASDHFTPFMLGDFASILVNLGSDIKIAEGESPRPVDRVFYRFNYYDNINPSRFNQPTSDIHNVTLYRNSFGFEKTIMDGRVSLGLRIPFNTIDSDGKGFVLNPAPGVAVAPGDASINTTVFGNISAIMKAILIEDKATGSLVSAGSTIVFPTAATKLVDPGPSTLAYLQPFGAFILSRGDFFVQGFTSITLPLAGAESTIMFNDLGVGYFVFRDAGGSGFIRSVAPTVEIHVTTPIRQPAGVTEFGFIDDVLINDTVDLTLGATVEFVNKMTLGVGCVIPICTTKPFDFEVLAQLNYRF